MIDRGRFSVLGASVCAVDLEAAAERVMEAARERRPLGVSAVAVHGVMTAFEDADYRHRLNQLELVVPDGQPVRWALNLVHRAALPERVYGPGLTLEVCRRAAEERLPLYLFGSTQATLRALAANLTARFPDLEISGSQPSRFRPASEAERRADVERIVSSGARIVLVGLGCPRQEIWAFENRLELSMPALAVGAAFDFHAGSLSQAPGWMQRAGLEWLYRLLQEPRRLWKRYLLLNPKYLFLLGLQLLRLRRFPVEKPSSPPPMLRPG